MRSLDNTVINPTLLSPSISQATCLSFMLRYSLISDYDPRTQPKISILVEDENKGQLTLPNKRDTWLKAQADLPAADTYQFGIYLEGQNFSVSFDNVSLSSTSCSPPSKFTNL